MTNELTDSDWDCLGILQEECAEVVQAVSKLRRSGLDFRPFGGDKTNLDNLLNELIDLKVLWNETFRRIGNGLSEQDLLFAEQSKRTKLRKWSTVLDYEVVSDPAAYEKEPSSD